MRRYVRFTAINWVRPSSVGGAPVVCLLETPPHKVQGCDSLRTFLRRVASVRVSVGVGCIFTELLGDYLKVTDWGLA